MSGTGSSCTGRTAATGTASLLSCCTAAQGPAAPPACGGFLTWRLTVPCCSISAAPVRSLPHASDPATDLLVNTTDHLVADIERLREHLGIECWLVFGGSWGSTLALAYAERHPERVSEMVIAAVTKTRRSEIQWLYHGVGRFFPAEWGRFREGAPAADRDGDLVEAYARLLAHPDAGIREQAARDWCDWEAAMHIDSPASRPCSSMAGSISAARC